MAHSLLGASSLDRRLQCPGSFVLEDGAPDSTSRYAAEGTVAHDLAARCLSATLPSPLGWLGEKFSADGFDFVVDVEMVESVEAYVARTTAYLTTANDSLLVEQELDIGWLVGIDGDKSTADAVIISPERLVVRDLKYGKGKRVLASKTVQPIAYALAALRQYDLLIDRDTLREVIVDIDQPRVAPPVSTVTFTLAELEAQEARIKAGVALCHEAKASELPNAEWNTKYLRPSDEGCQFCKAKTTCPALAAFVQETVAAQFEDIGAIATGPLPGRETFLRKPEVDGDELAVRLRAISLIEDWCAAQRKEGYDRLERDPRAIPGWSLQPGRKGSRKWVDEDAAEETLRGFRLPVDDIYDKKIISPTKAEKLLKESPRRWEKLVTLVTQSEGTPVLTQAEPQREVQAIADLFPQATNDDLV